MSDKILVRKCPDCQTLVQTNEPDGERCEACAARHAGAMSVAKAIVDQVGLYDTEDPVPAEEPVGPSDEEG